MRKKRTLEGKRDVRATAMAFAQGQGGIVARTQLLETGVPRSSIDRQLHRSLFPLFPGVYAIGRPQITQDDLWMAGVLCAGKGAVLGYRSAAALWGFMSVRPAVEVIRDRHRWNCRAKISIDATRQSVPLLVRRTRAMPDRDRAEIRGIPVTSVARTLLNLAAVIPESTLERVFLEADRLGLIVDEDLVDCAGRTNGHRGSVGFQRLCQSRLPGIGRLRSVLESMFLSMCLEEGIERPETNAMIGPFEVDCLWRSRRLIVELDGYEYHKGLEKFERDADRMSELRAQGWSTMRVTWRMLTEKPQVVAARVKAALGDTSGSTRP